MDDFKITDMIKKLEESKKVLNETTGEMKSLLKNLKDMTGIDTIKGNVEHVKKLEKEISSLDKKLNIIMNNLKEKF